MATNASATTDGFKTMTETPLALLNSTGASGHSDNIPSDHACLEMAHMLAQLYNSLFRGLNASYNKMPGILDTLSTSPTATRQFVLFNRYLVNTLAVQIEVIERRYLFEKVKKASYSNGAYPERLVQLATDLKYSYYLDMIHVMVDDDFNIYDMRRLQGMMQALGPALRSYVGQLLKWVLDLRKLLISSNSHGCRLNISLELMAARHLRSDHCKTIMLDTLACAKVLFSSNK
jgi:hypothetical protein